MERPLRRKRPMPPPQQRKWKKKRREGNKKKKKKQSDLHPPSDVFKHWNKLPHDLLSAIMERFSWVDRIRIRTVCKDWLIPINGIPHHDPFDRLPWMMTYRWNRNHIICKLIDPFRRRRYIVEETFNRKEWWGQFGGAKAQFLGAKVRASRNGWVLISKNKNLIKEDLFSDSGMLVFAFCPFTDEVVQLPEFEGDFERAAFSTTPTLPNCVFFLVSYKKELKISTCRSGDKTWTDFVYYGIFGSVLLDVNYADGNLYCVFQKGIVGAFNIVLQEWNLLPNVGLENVLWENAQIVATREELLLVYRGCILWRFDLLRREWERVKELENRMVFLGTTSFVVPAVGMLSEFSSKAYYFGPYKHEKGPIRVSDFRLRRRSFHSLYNCITDQAVGEMGTVWIEPPPALSSS